MVYPAKAPMDKAYIVSVLITKKIYADALRALDIIHENTAYIEMPMSKFFEWCILKGCDFIEKNPTIAPPEKYDKTSAWGEAAWKRFTFSMEGKTIKKINTLIWDLRDRLNDPKYSRSRFIRWCVANGSEAIIQQRMKK